MILPGIFASQISGHLYAGPTGAFDALGSVTVGSGGQSSITFSAIPQTYTHLQIRGIHRSTTSGTSATGGYVKLNGDTGTNYSTHILYGNGSSAAAYSASSTANVIYADVVDGSATANVFGAFVMDILDYSNTTKNKTGRTLYGWDLNGSGTMALESFGWYNTAAVNSITFTPSSGNFAQYSSYALYGIK